MQAKTQKGCKGKLARAIEKSGKIDVTKSDQYTVEEWCWLWHENYCKLAVRDSTAKYYRSYIGHHIALNIGKIRLEKLTTLDLQKFYDQTKKGGRVEKYEGMKDKSLSARTVRGLHAMLRTALDQAVKERLIPYDPVIGCLRRRKKDADPSGGEDRCVPQRGGGARRPAYVLPGADHWPAPERADGTSLD